MRFTFRQLEYFIAAGETGSVTLAAERAHISQASVSTAVSHLEGELGVQLFLRHHAQGLSLTPIGRTVLLEAKRVIELADGLYSLAQESGDHVRGQLSLGCLITLAPMVLPELSQSFTTAHPGTEIRPVEANQERLLEALRRAEIDVALLYDMQLPAGISFLPLARLPAQVWLAANHPLARRREIALAELAPQPMILLDLPFSRDYFLGLFSAQGLEPRVTARSASHEVVRTMVANGYGYTIANVRPRSDLALDGRRVVRVPLAGDHRALTLGLASLGPPTRSRLMTAFEAHCRARVSDDTIPGMVPPRG